MEKITSFTIDHIKLQPGVYVSRKDPVGDQVITTFDIRMTSPNEEPVMNTAELHAMEHLPFFFDCSTTVVTRGKLEMYNKMGKPLPDGWALDKNGHASNNAPDVLANIVAKKGGGIMPLGGNEEVSGSHKGYGYGMLCELFSSILSMGVTSDKCCTFPDKTGICHGFMAINPAAFGDPDAIRKHFSEYLEALRESPKADGQDRIYTHGEKEVAAEKDRKENGIPVNDNTMVELADLCSYLKLDFGSYFEGYELPKDSKFFNGNY